MSDLENFQTNVSVDGLEQPSLGFRTLGEYVLVEPIDPPKTFADGQLMLPESAQERPQQGIIVSVGSGVLTGDGYRVDPEVAVNDRILFAKYGGTEIKVNGKTYFILKERDILVIFDN